LLFVNKNAFPSRIHCQRLQLPIQILFTQHTSNINTKLVFAK